MSTFTHRPLLPLGLADSRRPPAAARQQGVAAGWLDRLAAWAERQPTHRRLGSYTPLAG